MSVLSDLIDLARHTRARGGGSPGEKSVITLPHTINRAALLCMATSSKDLQRRANVETPDDCKALTNIHDEAIALHIVSDSWRWRQLQWRAMRLTVEMWDDKSCILFSSKIVDPYNQNIHVSQIKCMLFPRAAHNRWRHRVTETAIKLNAISSYMY